MTLRDVAGDVMRRQEPAQAQHTVWAERARLLRTDRLTGLTNQLGWQEALDEAMFASSRFGSPLVVARIDLDRSPADQAATQPLLSFAGRARQVVRNGDLFARLDGDVLVVALARCAAPTALQVLERIRTSVQAEHTCSVGWTVWDGHESQEMLMERAGAALALAQERGGDQLARL